MRLEGEHAKTHGRAMHPSFAMLEVKSERDRLHPSQHAWLKQLQSKVPTAVVNVRPPAW